MSGSDPKPPRDKDLNEKDLKAREKTSGRVAFDSRGNAVWEWKMRTGVFGRDVDTGKLRMLEAKELKIAADPAAPPSTQDQKQEAVKAAKAGGFDPYNSNTHSPGRAATPNRPAPRPGEKPEKPGLFRRLFGKG